MRSGNYCSQTCGFCQCVVQEDGCAACDDISPDSTYSCAEQKRFGKCDEPWMKPFCRRTCGRCDCDFEESFAFGFVDASNDRVRTITSPLKEVLVDEESGECPKSIFDALTNASQFTLLVEIVKSVGLDSTLRDSNVSISLFAPVNEAFSNLALDFGLTLDDFVSEYPEKVLEILQYHVVPYAIKDNKELGNTFSFPTLVPEKRLFGSSSVEVDGIGSSATILQDQVKICRSVVYTIDEVLLPGMNLDEIGPVVERVPEPQEEIQKCNPESDLLASMEQDPELSIFVQALKDSELSRSLEGEDVTYTVFAPTNEAFEITLAELGMSYAQIVREKQLLESIVNYHIIKENLEAENLFAGKFESLGGDTLVIAVEKTGIEIAGSGSSANVIEEDIDDVCTSAVHKIDSTLLPFDSGSEIWAATRSEGKGASKKKNSSKRRNSESCNSIAHLLARNSQLRVLNSVARGAGLLPELADEEQSLTIFAPTDTAFYARFLNPESGELSLLLTDPEILQSIFTYHTIDRPLTFKNLRPGRKLETQLLVEDEPLKLSVVKKRLSPTGVILRGERDDEAAIVQKNIVACKSVIHLIDAVLMPFEIEEQALEDISDNQFTLLELV